MNTREQKAKRIIIVCDKMHEKYANYPHQLMSMKDDRDGNSEADYT